MHQATHNVRLKRAIAEAQLPSAKGFSTFDFSQCPQFKPSPLMQLGDDPGWLERADNLLLFGASGVGRTQILHEAVKDARKGRETNRLQEQWMFLPIPRI